jgi:hypothetical protein
LGIKDRSVWRSWFWEMAQPLLQVATRLAQLKMQPTGDRELHAVAARKPPSSTAPEPGSRLSPLGRRTAGILPSRARSGRMLRVRRRYVLRNSAERLRFLSRWPGKCSPSSPYACKVARGATAQEVCVACAASPRATGSGKRRARLRRAATHAPARKPAGSPR